MPSCKIFTSFLVEKSNLKENIAKDTDFSRKKFAQPLNKLVSLS